MNRPITSTEIETRFKKLPTKKSPGPDGILSNFQKRANTFPSETVPKNCRRRETFKLIL